jgi:hypothetical protein
MLSVYSLDRRDGLIEFLSELKNKGCNCRNMLLLLIHLSPHVTDAVVLIHLAESHGHLALFAWHFKLGAFEFEMPRSLRSLENRSTLSHRTLDLYPLTCIFQVFHKLFICH